MGDMRPGTNTLALLNVPSQGRENEVMEVTQRRTGNNVRLSLLSRPCFKVRPPPLVILHYGMSCIRCHRITML
jgi:hypothetical protein